MVEINEFNTPRNLFEKLLRDANQLEKTFNGDNVLNFISTAYQLELCIKKSELSKGEVVKRFLKRIIKDQNFKFCKEVATCKRPFSTMVDTLKKERKILSGDNVFDGIDFKNEIIELYSLYFRVKGN